MNQGTVKTHTGFPFLFSPLTVEGHEIRNRLVALPVHTGFAYPDGRASPWMVDFYTRLAASGVGMVIVANAAVSADGAVSRFNLRADREAYIKGLARLAHSIKQQGTIACLQLNHAGRFARTDRPLLPSPISGANLTFNVESLKDFMEFFPFEKRFNLTRYCINQFKTWRQPMTDQDREQVIKDFADAAYRAYRAGFDMVELHGANGYLLCQYLSGFTNKLQKDYGPDFDRRAKFPLEVLKAVQNRLPKHFPVGFRLILKEWVPDGIDLPESLAFAALLESRGIAYLSASVGSYNSIFSRDVSQIMAAPAYLENETARLKKTVTIPILASGRIITPDIGERLLQRGITDLIGLGRPLRTDSKWVEKAKAGGKKIIPCINCNSCLKRVVLEQGFCCKRWPKIFREKTRLAHQLLTRTEDTLWIIADPADIDTFKQCWPLLDPGRGVDAYPKVLFLERAKEGGKEAADNSEPPFRPDPAYPAFIRWITSRISPKDRAQSLEPEVVATSPAGRESALLQELARYDPGRVFIAARARESWRERLLYKQRGRVTARLSYNAFFHRILVPIDFSSATLLVMKFLQQTLIKNDQFHFCFLHVASILPEGLGSGVKPEQQWEKFKRITEFDVRSPLQVIKPASDVTSALIEVVKTHRYGTVIMGKRGLSGIKRWLLGSVSQGVLNSLDQETLFFID